MRRAGEVLPVYMSEWPVSRIRDCPTTVAETRSSCDRKHAQTYEKFRQDYQVDTVFEPYPAFVTHVADLGLRLYVVCCTTWPVNHEPALCTTSKTARCQKASRHCC